MRKHKKYLRGSRIYSRSMKKKHFKYTLPSNVHNCPQLPECYSILNGFLMKNGTIIGFVSPGIIQIAEDGFLHVDEDEEYITG